MRALLDFVLPRAEPVFAEARADDAAAAAAIHGASFGRGWTEHEFTDLLAARTTVAHRALVRGRLAGFIVTRIAGDEAEILSVAVFARDRGRGIAGKLLDLNLRHLAGRGVRAVFLDVEEGNAPARRLYARAHFREVGRRKGYYARGSEAPGHALVLRRDLVSA